MTGESSFETERLVLRRWQKLDSEPFAQMNADLRVTEFLGSPLDHAASDGFIRRIEEHFDRHGFGLWAAESKQGGELAGYVGLMVPSFTAHFTPCVEIGWRLGFGFQGRGLATEGARAVLRLGFGEFGLAEVVSFATVGNVRSQRVMEKLGMSRDPAEDFDHPRLTAGDPLRRHVLYRAKAGRPL